MNHKRLIKKEDAIKFAKKYNINLKKVNVSQLIKGMKVELEHGSKISSKTNVTKNNKEKTFQIALAHLIEYPDYYIRLEKMEKQAERYWKGKNKNIFNKH